jgi:hypothetical protein
MKNITGFSSSAGAPAGPSSSGDSGATTLRDRQSSLIGWYLPTPSSVYIFC